MRPHTLLTYLEFSVTVSKFPSSVTMISWEPITHKMLSLCISLHSSILYFICHFITHTLHPYYTLSSSWPSFPPKWNFIIHLLSTQITKAAITQVLGKTASRLSENLGVYFSFLYFTQFLTNRDHYFLLACLTPSSLNTCKKLGLDWDYLLLNGQYIFVQHLKEHTTRTRRLVIRTEKPNSADFLAHPASLPTAGHLIQATWFPRIYRTRLVSVSLIIFIQKNQNQRTSLLAFNCWKYC